ncbi:hypothetical protein OBBRIDRAFT_804888 [Obba rivulosa]|uniref:DUF6533 domain-containing protein n=1 Tax=Obba rivulosa TaxID=1052685 RepID=A0A8E2ARA3_9APHY|nr:hypothetical protein OBBRIDRAFT_804888 [Obba rivulosa]
MDVQNMLGAETSMLQGMQINRYCALAALTILYLDYGITFPLEVEAFWRQDCVTLVSILFVLNRYMSLLGYIPIVLEFFADLSELYLVLAIQIVVAALLVLRTYALYEKNKRVLYLLVLGIVAGTGVGAWPAFTDEGSDNTGSLSYHHGCDLSVSVQQARHLMGPWSVVLAFDTVVFALTAVRGIQMRGLWNIGLFRTFLRDGAIYYGTMVVLNILNMLTILPEQKGMLTCLTNVTSLSETSQAANCDEGSTDSQVIEDTAFCSQTGLVYPKQCRNLESLLRAPLAESDAASKIGEVCQNERGHILTLGLLPDASAVHERIGIDIIIVECTSNLDTVAEGERDLPRPDETLEGVGAAVDIEGAADTSVGILVTNDSASGLGHYRCCRISEKVEYERGGNVVRSSGNWSTSLIPALLIMMSPGMEAIAVPEIEETWRTMGEQE